MSSQQTPRRSGRLRLFVIQALVFSLFATLFVRLYYLQVVGGEEYHAQATSQSVREIVVQPQRGLIVDDMGRPLVANRTSWVVSIDRAVLGKLTDRQQDVLVDRVARVVHVPVTRVRAQLVTCGDPGSEPGVCWNGSPYQPVPIATDVKKAAALRVLEQPEDFPGIVADQQSVRAYPQPYGINLAHVLGYLSPITEDEYDQATADRDTSVNAASSVGRAGIEKEYDRWLRGMPGYKSVAVDSMGRVLGDDGEVAGRPGDTLVTSIDAKVQGLVEKQLADTIATARQTYDEVTHKNYVADTGAAVVMEARTGRIVAMASQPTYDPETWVGGISKKELARLYSARADNPLLSRATQGQFAPGSTWKPIMTVGGLNNGFTPDTRLDCSSGLQVGNRWFKNYESASYGSIGFDQALQLSCDTFFYRVGLKFWQQYGSDPTDVDAKDPLVDQAKDFGFGQETGIDLPGEAAGRIADRHWKLAYWKSMRSYYCGVDDDGSGKRDFLHVFAHEFCLEGSNYRAGDAVNYSIGQGDTIVTPLQLARAYAALSNGGTLYEPRIAKAVVSPDGTLLRTIAPKVQA
jgi:penicillin-binding protein 2